MSAVAAFADGIRGDRHAVADNSPLKQQEAQVFAAVHELLLGTRTQRDAALEKVFALVYGGGAAPPAAT